MKKIQIQPERVTEPIHPYASGGVSAITQPDLKPIPNPRSFCPLRIRIIRRAKKICANFSRFYTELGQPNHLSPSVQLCLQGGFGDTHASIPVRVNHVPSWLIGAVRKLLIILFFLLLLTENSFAQKQGLYLIDSLKADLVNTSKDTNLVKTLGLLSFEYSKYDTKLGIRYGEQALHLADSLKWKVGIASANNNIGTNNLQKGHYPKALEYYTKSLTLYTEIGDSRMIAILYNNIGLFNIDVKNYPKAIEYLNESLTINKRINNRKGICLNYSNLGLAYSEKKQFEKSNEYYNKALQIHLALNNKDAISKNLTNISFNKISTKEYCEALEYSFRALKTSVEIKSINNQGLCNRDIGEAYYRLATDSSNTMNGCKYFKSDKREYLITAIGHLKESFAFFTQANNLRMMYESSLLLSQAYEALGDTKNALSLYKISTEKKDSMFSNDKSKIIASIEGKFEIDSREKQLAIKTLEIKNKNAQMLFQIILFALILITISILFYALYKRQRIQKVFNLELKNKNIELENYLFVASHDLRSPMVNIQGFSQRLQKQSDAIRAILDESQLDAETKTGLEKITDEGIPKTLNFILSNITKMDTLINGLLQVSRTGRVNMVIQRVDMNKLFKTIIAGNNFLISEVSAKVVVKDLPDCYGDENLLNQLFSNIIGNAIKYRDKTRPLVLKIGGQTKYSRVVYSINDTGIGIPAKYLEKIWDVFFRVDANSPEAGEGLGLNLAKRITDKHKGKIWVESEEGVGSTFYVELQKNEFTE